MANYLAVTQPTADWLISHRQYFDAVASDVERLSSTTALQQSVLAVGAMRMAISKRGSPLCIWNVDYLDSTGDEKWGFIRLAEPYGLESHPTIYAEILERALYVINQRQQGLKLPDAFIHRHHFDNLHTCVAGRGSDARHFSIAYSDGKIAIDNARRTAVTIVGPDRGEGKGSVEERQQAIIQFLQAERDTADRILEAADATIRESPRRPALDAVVFTNLRDRFSPRSLIRQAADGPAAELPPLCESLSPEQQYGKSTLTYQQWLAPGSSLTAEQREILESDIIDRHPVRIIGPAGSGKSLLMQLLALRMLHRARQNDSACQVLYIVHNSAMQNLVIERFNTLCDGLFFQPNSRQILHVETLLGFSQRQLNLSDTEIVDKDASETKDFQLSMIHDALTLLIKERDLTPERFPLLSQLARDEDLIRLCASLIASEIGVTIKGHDLVGDKKKYVESERSLSRLHGALTSDERGFVFDVFQTYHNVVFEGHGVLDSDDLAITLLAKLRTPLWSMKRRVQGVDYLFVDETQLFNENERRLFAYLPKRAEGNLPIALALDEAQELKGAISAGFGLLGITAIEDERLQVVYRSTPDILRLAFHLVQRTTDLFGANFPDFTGSTVSVVPADHKLARKPILVQGGTASSGIGKYIEKRIMGLRAKNIRQIAVVVHGEKYWDQVEKALGASRLPLFKLTRRGERIDQSSPMVVLARPDIVGGQEFDAVICVGLEAGIVPPRIEQHEALAETLRQQALREMYLVFTRARYQLVIANMVNSSPSPLLLSAIESKLLEID